MTTGLLCGSAQHRRPERLVRVTIGYVLTFAVVFAVSTTNVASRPARHSIPNSELTSTTPWAVDAAVPRLEWMSCTNSTTCMTVGTNAAGTNPVVFTTSNGISWAMTTV